MSFFRSTLCLMAVLAIASRANAGTASANMNVTATVTDSCSLSAGDLTFGNYDPTSVSALTGTATLQVMCTLDSAATIVLDQGAQPEGTSTAAAPLRQMADGAERLTYILSQDAGHTIPWGGGAAAQDYTGLGVGTSLTVYGRIAAQQVVSSGSFSDIVTATVNF